MSLTSLHVHRDTDMEFDDEIGVPHVVVVDPKFDAYKDLAAAARQGKINLHFRSSGADAIKLSRRTRVDVWLVAEDLDDVSGADFVTLLQSRVGTSRLAIVESATAGSEGSVASAHVAPQTAADAVLCPPITLGDVERLLGRSAGERVVMPTVTSTATRPFVTLPMGVSAAVAAVAVLMLG